MISAGNSSASASGRDRISPAETVSPSTLVSLLPRLFGNQFCSLMATECTFLGPSRKRGPPKGYIDAIEARLHQTEAVLGIILSLAGGLDGSRGPGDQGASSLIEDLCQVRRLFRNQFPSSSLCTDKPSITGSACPLHPPSRRGDTIWFKVEGQAAYRPAVEIEAARLFGYFGTVSSLPPFHQSFLTSVPFPPHSKSFYGRNHPIRI